MAAMTGPDFSDIAFTRVSKRPGLPAGQRLTMSGFSLIELMVVVTMVAILGALAAPSFTVLLRNNRLAAASSAMQVSLSLARSEAVKRGSDAVVTVAANGTAGSWTNGWTVFVDNAKDAHGSIGPAADDTTIPPAWIRLEVVGARSGSISVGQTGSLNYFSYNGQGRMIDVSGAGVVNRSFWFFDDTSERYCLIVNNTGRVRAERVASSASCPTA